MNILTDDITCNITFDSPNPEYKSFMNVHGWSETRNAYLFDTKVNFNDNHCNSFLFIFLIKNTLKINYKF